MRFVYEVRKNLNPDMPRRRFTTTFLLRLMFLIYFIFLGLCFQLFQLNPLERAVVLRFFCLFAIKQAGIKLALTAEHFIINFVEDLLFFK